MSAFSYGHIFESYQAATFQSIGSRAAATTQYCDLRSSFSAYPVVDQRPYNSCTAHAVAAIWWFALYRRTLAARKQGWQSCAVTAPPSRMYVYNRARIAAGISLNDDRGCSFAKAFAVLQGGAPAEWEFPYVARNLNVVPDSICVSSATRRIFPFTVQRIVTLDDMLSCLASWRPFVAALSVAYTFPNTLKSGLVPTPTENQIAAGHAMVVVGYDTSRRLFIFRNSWGPKWGAQGHCFIPFDYITNPSFSREMFALCA